MPGRKENISMAIHREKINLYKTVKKIFPKILIKDLDANERICPECHGLGVKINTRVFGIGDSLESYSYRTEALSFCPHCFNGVQKYVSIVVDLIKVIVIVKGNWQKI